VLIQRQPDITFDGDSTVSFKFILPTLKTVECALCIPDNYPKEELTLVGGLTEEGDLKMFDASDLKGVFSKIVDGTTSFFGYGRFLTI